MGGGASDAQGEVQRLCGSRAGLRVVVQGGVVELPGHLLGQFSSCPGECPTLLPQLF